MSDKGFTKENLDLCLKELAKEHLKRNGKTMPVEIILIGRASVVINYGFRESTYDMDAVIQIRDIESCHSNSVRVVSDTD